MSRAIAICFSLLILATPCAARRLSLAQISEKDLSRLFVFEGLPIAVGSFDEVAPIDVPFTVSDGRLQSRRSRPGTLETIGEGLTLYLYRIDLSDVVGSRTKSCIDGLSFDFGDIARLDYDGDGTDDDGVIVLEDAHGRRGPSRADEDGGRISLTFDGPVCADLTRGQGGVTLFTAFASRLGARLDVANAESSPSRHTEVRAQVPASPRAIAFTVDHFSYPCGGSGSDLEHCGAFGDALQKFADDTPGWHMRAPSEDSKVQARHWTDSSKLGKTWGADDVDQSGDHGADSANVALLCTHGGKKDGNQGQYWSSFQMGGAGSLYSQDCDPNTLENLQLGNDSGHLEVAIGATCSSAEKSVWDSATSSGVVDYSKGYWPIRSDAGSFTTMLGFNGDSFDELMSFPDYLWAARDDGLGSLWIGLMAYDSFLLQCPAAMVFCGESDRSDCDRQFVEGGLDDRHQVSPEALKRYGSYYFIQGCQPSGKFDKRLPRGDWR